MFCPTPVTTKVKVDAPEENDFLLSLATYFTKFIFDTVGSKVD